MPPLPLHTKVYLKVDRSITGVVTNCIVNKSGHTSYNVKWDNNNFNLLDDDGDSPRAYRRPELLLLPTNNDQFEAIKEASKSATKNAHSKRKIENQRLSRRLVAEQQATSSDNEDDDESEVDDGSFINQDAAKFEKTINETLIFHTCGVCSREFGLVDCRLLSDLEWEICSSDMPEKCRAMKIPALDVDNAQKYSKYEISYSKETVFLLDDNGVLKNAIYCCVKCVAGLPKRPKEANQSVPTKCSPVLALVNGHFRGRIPQELQNLNRTELMFSVLNDVHAISTILPRIPTFNEIAILRSSDCPSPDGFRYSPYKVLAAMQWLSENNSLYENTFIRPDGVEWQNSGQLDSIPVPSIDITDADCEGLTELSAAAGPDGHAVNPSAPDSGMTDVFLMPNNSSEDRDLITQVERIVESSTRSSEHKATRVTVRTQGVFARDYETPDFLQRAFVNLFPFGKGGPDTSTGVIFNEAYIVSLLNLGMGREFQQSPSFIFYAYAWKMKRTVGSVSWLATRNDGNNAIDPSDHISVADCNAFLEYCSRKRQRDMTTTNYHSVELMHNLITEARLLKLMARLQPYATEMPGSELYMAADNRRVSGRTRTLRKITHV